MEESNNPVDIRALGEKIAQESAFVKLLTSEINNVIVGQSQMIERLMIGLLGGGHILLEGVPGLAKTLAINSLAKAVDGDFSIKKGPVFANFVLADEINRAPAKVQSALLEAMQERQVTIGEETFRLDDPFLVMATQNPIEQEGTYPLPEAQMDRFMLKTVVSYPTKEDEQRIMRRNTRPEGSKAIRPVVSLDDIRRGREAAKEVYMDEKIEHYILDIVFATRFPEEYKLDKLKPLIAYGASPRGSINLVTASKVYAFLRGRAYVIPEDVRAIAPDVLRHRIGVTYEAEAENVHTEEIINTILNEVQVP